MSGDKPTLGDRIFRMRLRFWAWGMHRYLHLQRTCPCDRTVFEADENLGGGLKCVRCHSWWQEGGTANWWVDR